MQMHNRAQHSVRRHLEGKKYIPAKVSEWVDAINNEVIEEAKKISSNFKYVSYGVSCTLLVKHLPDYCLLFFCHCLCQVVNCVIHQQAGAGMHSSTVTHWDAKHDCSVMVRFESETMTCVVMVFGISI